MGVKIFVFVLLITITIASKQGKAQAQTNSTDSLAKNGCSNRCGEVVVPFPFGVNRNCALSDNFLVQCNDYGALLSSVDLKVLNISLETGKVWLLWGFVSYICNGSPNVTFPGIDLKTTQYTLSNTNNEFIAAGVNNTARIEDESGRFFGCSTETNFSYANGNACSGYNGCCQIHIPCWLARLSKENVQDVNNGPNNSLCSAIILAEKGNFSVDQANQIISGEGDDQRSFPIVWDWVVEKITCDKAVNRTNYACVNLNSECVNSTNGDGYRCKCKDGYRGNPYLSDGNGCQDIDECLDGNPCPEGQTCRNTNGTFTCTTDKGLPTYGKILIGVGVGLLVLLLVASWICWVIQKRNFVKRKEKFFHQNGGLLLQQQISNNQEDAFKIFTAAELEKATDKYSDERILGKGGFGTVYRGSLSDGREIAIKKSMMVDENGSKEFAKEMLILSQINHVNVVKLLGCCLDVEVPMLVYEFIPHGTLYHYIHHMRYNRPISWSIRLKLAAESAKALGYLHEEASPPILHGDIKSLNILLGDNYTAKVSDFGTSTLAPKDRSKFVTVVQGTWGYLDPEYLQTGQLTEKSDVYSFGVVMAELLTGRKATYKDGDGVERNLASEFNTFVKTNRLLEILDEQIVGDEKSLMQIEVVARLAVRSLSMLAEERPTMTQLSIELETLKRSVQHTWAMPNREEMHYEADQKSNSSTVCLGIDPTSEKCTHKPSMVGDYGDDGLEL